MRKAYIAKMNCPYCHYVFGLTLSQIINNKTFTCPNCHKANQGSTKADENDILVGLKSIKEAK